MEQIKVNMIPNGEVKTIHCSKGDGKTRKWGFELYKEDGIIPSSSISPQMFFDSYKGGTEQILPENTSDPTTSPIIADIQYPDALRSEQEFLYRESPATVDGKAKITKIKGNTLVFNQLVPNGNFANSDNWRAINSTLSMSDNVCTQTMTTAEWSQQIAQDNHAVIAGHKYYLSITIKTPSASDGVLMRLYATTADTRSRLFNTSANVFTKVSDIVQVSSSYTASLLFYPQFQTTAHPHGFEVGAVVQFKNAMMIDLTQMFGAGNEPTSVETIQKLLPNDYYNYTTGTLMNLVSDMGLKTTGKNLIDLADFDNGSTILYSDGVLSGTAGAFNTDYNTFNNKGVEVDIPSGVTFLSFEAYTDGNSSTSGSGLVANALFSDGTNANLVSIPNNTSSFTRYGTRLDKNVKKIGFTYVSQGSNIWHLRNMQLEFCSDTETQGTSYEPYTTSTLSLPISTYFATGMKSAGSVYDELTESKATTRIGMVDLGTLTWVYYSAANRFYTTQVPSDMIYNNDTGIVPNITSSKYQPTTPTGTFNSSSDKLVSILQNYILIVDKSTTDASTLKSSLSGVYLYYELATPTETTINTASLVSEQAEIPLYEDDDILIGECTTQLSSESGFIPTKIKYQDDNGVAYSQKINLHVENNS